MVLDLIPVLTREFKSVETCPDLSVLWTLRRWGYEGGLKRRKRLQKMTPMYPQADVFTASEIPRDPELGFKILQWGQGVGVLPEGHPVPRAALMSRRSPGLWAAGWDPKPQISEMISVPSTEDE